MVAHSKTDLTRTPLHVQIAVRLREEIVRNHRGGDRFGSQNELARCFGVSAITIREAVGALVQEGLLERRHGSGTFVRDVEADKLVGVLIEQDISCPGTSYYWTRITQQLRLLFEREGYRARLYAGHTASHQPAPERPSCPEFWHDLQANRLRGLAVVGTDVRESWLRELRERGVQMVATSSDRQVIPNATFEMIRAGTRKLIERGRRKLAVVNWGTAASPGGECLAFQAELAEQGLSPRDAWVCHAGEDTHDAFAGLNGFRQLWLAENDKPDGLVICSDRLLQSTLSAVRLMNIAVPETLMIAAHTHRGENTGALPFPIIRMEVDPDEHAERLGGALIDRMAGRPVRRNPDFKPFRILEPDKADDQARPDSPVSRADKTGGAVVAA